MYRGWMVARTEDQCYLKEQGVGVTSAEEPHNGMVSLQVSVPDEVLHRIGHLWGRCCWGLEHE